MLTVLVRGPKIGRKEARGGGGGGGGGGEGEGGGRAVVTLMPTTSSRTAKHLARRQGRVTTSLKLLGQQCSNMQLCSYEPE